MSHSKKVVPSREGQLQVGGGEDDQESHHSRKGVRANKSKAKPYSCNNLRWVGRQTHTPLGVGEEKEPEEQLQVFAPVNRLGGKCHRKEKTGRCEVPSNILGPKKRGLSGGESSISDVGWGERAPGKKKCALQANTEGQETKITVLSSTKIRSLKKVQRGLRKRKSQ